jgi:hypothetical protein
MLDHGIQNMTSEVPPSALVEVGLQYAREHSPDMSVMEEEALKKLFLIYFGGKEPLEKMQNIFISIIGSAEPIEKIHKILQELVMKPPQMNPSLSNKKTIRSWNKDEDRRLLAGIHQYGLKNWTKVSEFVGNGRCRGQCSQRWSRGLSPDINKCMWSKGEEATLLKLVEKYGIGAWTKISREMKYRTDAQCRFHYKHFLQRSTEKVFDPKIALQMEVVSLASSPTSQSHSSPAALSDLQAKPLIPPISSFGEMQKGLFSSMTFNFPPLPK